MSRGAPCAVRLQALILHVVGKKGGSWVNLDLEHFASSLGYSKRHIHRVIKDLRHISQESPSKIGLVFRSINKTNGRGRTVVACSLDWYRSHGEAFEESSEGKSRGLRRSFEPGEEPIRGSFFSTQRPTDIPKKIPLVSGNNNTRSRSGLQKLRRLSYFLSHEIEREGLLEAFKRSEVNFEGLRNVIWSSLKAGYWRDSILSAVRYALRLAHTAACDDLARCPFGYFVFGVRDWLKNNCTDSAETSRKKCAEFWQGTIDIGRQTFESCGMDYEPAPELIEKANKYGLHLS